MRTLTSHSGVRALGSRQKVLGSNVSSVLKLCARDLPSFLFLALLASQGCCKAEVGKFYVGGPEQLGGKTGQDDS